MASARRFLLLCAADDDDDHEEYDLQAESAGEEEEEELGDVSGLLCNDAVVDSKELHEEVDAARRDVEEAQCRELAARYEDMAKSYMQDADAGVTDGAMMRRKATANRRKAAKAAKAAERAEAERAEAAELAEAQAARAKQAAKQAAIYALYDDDDDDDVAPAGAAGPVKRKAVDEKKDKKAADLEGIPESAGHRYRIKKRRPEATA